MSEWTSISLKQTQKDQLKADKPDDLAMGKYLVQLAESNDLQAHGVDVDLESVVREAIADLDVTVESENEKTLDVLVERIMQRLKSMDDDVKQAAYAGAKEAVEEVAR